MGLPASPLDLVCSGAEGKLLRLCEQCECRRGSAQRVVGVGVKACQRLGHGDLRNAEQDGWAGGSMVGRLFRRCTA